MKRFCRGTGLTLRVAYLCLLGGACMAQGLISVRIGEFKGAGKTTEVFRTLVRSVYFKGVVGFESLDDIGWINATAANADFGTALRAVCGADPRYRIVSTNSADVVNILAAEHYGRGREILEFRIPKLDIELDEWPENLITRLPDYSPSLWGFLREVYLRSGGVDIEPPGAGAGFYGNAKRPHFSVHLVNASVRDALNAIAAQSFQIYRTIGIDPRLVATPDQLRVAPTGWELRFLEPHDMPFYTWVYQIFRTLS